MFMEPMINKNARTCIGCGFVGHNYRAELFYLFPFRLSWVTIHIIIFLFPTPYPCDKCLAGISRGTFRNGYPGFLTTIGSITKFLSPDIAIGIHASIKLHFSLSLVISQTKQKQNKTQNNDFCT